MSSKLPPLVGFGIVIISLFTGTAKSILGMVSPLSADECMAHEAQKRLSQRKLRSCQLVKQCQAIALRKLLADAEAYGERSLRGWQTWKGHSGRAMPTWLKDPAAYARKVRAASAHDFLERSTRTKQDVGTRRPSLETTAHAAQSATGQQRLRRHLGCTLDWGCT